MKPEICYLAHNSPALNCAPSTEKAPKRLFFVSPYTLCTLFSTVTTNSRAPPPKLIMVKQSHYRPGQSLRVAVG